MAPISVISFVVLVLLSMFFSGSETAITTVPAHKVDTFIKQKKNGAKFLKYCKLESDKVLMAILIGNNIVNIAASSLATTISISIAANLNYSQGTVVGLVTAFVTIIILIFGEILPKTFAQKHAEKIALKISVFYFYFTKLLSPIIWCLSLLTKKINKSSSSESGISQEEVEVFMDMARKSEAVEEDTYENIKKMLNFNDITVEEAMTPRIRINAISDSLTINQAIEKLLTFHYTRIPVYHKSIDDADRVITLKELLNISNKQVGETMLKNLMLHPILKIPSPTPIDVAMEKFKSSHKHIALVMDEFGGVNGIITLEDIIEEIFGNIQDENDIEITPIRKLGKNIWNVSSFVRIDEFLEESKLTFEELGLDEDECSGETLSYLITSILERFPVEGEKLSIPLKNLNDDIEVFGKGHHSDLHRTLTIEVSQIVDNTIGDLKISIG